MGYIYEAFGGWDMTMAQMSGPEKRQISEKLPSIAIIGSDRSGQIVTVVRDIPPPPRLHSRGG